MPAHASPKRILRVPGSWLLIAAAARPDSLHAIVSRGGRSDLADDALPGVRTPTLLIVGGLDTAVIEMNQSATEQMDCPCEIEIVEGASHLFEEPGKLDEVANLAGQWFQQHLHADAS
ncbi:MAG: hypothetical protein ACOC3G_07720 [Phycisphaeraceae bacterium]